MEATEVRKLAELEDRHWWYAERRWLLRRAVRRSGVLRETTRPVALDIGAAGGGNTRVLRSLGMLAVAVEYGAEGASVAAGRALPVVRGDALALPFAAGCADVVVAFDVLEHLTDDAAALAELRRMLRPGGRLLIAVPAGMDLWSAHDVAVGHVRRYSGDALVGVVRAAGFDDVRVRSWNVLLRPVVKLRRRSSTGSDLEDTPRLLGLALGAVVGLERFLPLGRLPGVTLLLDARARGGVRVVGRNVRSNVPAGTTATLRRG